MFDLRWIVIAGVVSLMGCPGAKQDGSTCGNAVIDSGEECDTSDVTCMAAGYSGGGLAYCQSDCTLDLTNCGPSLCGNGEIDFPEECDGPDVTCASLGEGTGTAVCDDTCRYDISGCEPVGDGEVTVEVRVNGVPKANAPVAIADATGASVASGVTDAQGTFTHVIGADHQVTVGHTRPTGTRELQTFTDVDSGDTVVFDFTEAPSTPITTLGKTNTTFPTVAGATTHRSTNGCLEATTSASSGQAHLQNVFSTCVDAQQEASVFGEVFDGTGNQLGYKFCSELPLDTTTPTDCAITALDTAYTNMECTLTDVPAGTGDIQVTYSIGMGTVTFRPYAQLIVSPTAGQTYVRTKPMPDAPFVKRATCTMSLDSSDLESSRQCTATLAAPGAVSFAGTLVPTAITGATVDTSDANRPALSWTEGPASGTPDVTAATIRFTSNNGSMSWTLNGPGTTSSPMRAPALPADASFTPYQPSLFTAVISSSNVRKVDYVSITGYKGLFAGPVSTAPPSSECSSSRFAE